MKRLMPALCIAFLLVLAAACRPAPTPAPQQASEPTEAPAAAPTAAPASATTAISTGGETPAGAEPTAASEATPMPGELVKFSGDEFAVSDPFQLDADANVEIAWEHSGQGPFTLWLVNDSEDLADPSLYRVLVEQGSGEDKSAAQFTLTAGEYHLEVEQADGPWTVLVRSLE